MPKCPMTVQNHDKYGSRFRGITGEKRKCVSRFRTRVSQKCLNFGQKLSTFHCCPNLSTDDAAYSEWVCPKQLLGRAIPGPNAYCVMRGWMLELYGRDAEC
jgi:hypothetical protein